MGVGNELEYLTLKLVDTLFSVYGFSPEELFIKRITFVNREMGADGGDRPVEYMAAD
jgi:hypothetical protein